MKVNRFFSFASSLGVILSRDLDNEPVPFRGIQLGGAAALYNNVMCPFRSLQRYIGAILAPEGQLGITTEHQRTAVRSSNSSTQS